MYNRIDEVHGMYAGKRLWIVGKGPSLLFLRHEHFMDDGPVITINEAILTVQELHLANPLYSLQKDGKPDKMVRPHNTVCLILQYPGFSENCFPQHPRRIHVTADELGFGDEVTVMSVRMCIAIGKRMGCTRMSLMCCDSIANSDMRIYDPKVGNVLPSGASGHYAAVIPTVKAELMNIEHEFITPKVP